MLQHDPKGKIATNLPTYAWESDPKTAEYFLYLADAEGSIIISGWARPEQVSCGGNESICSISPVFPLDWNQHYSWGAVSVMWDGGYKWSEGSLFNL